MKTVVSVALGSAVALGLAVVFTERFPVLRRGWRARQGRRPFLFVVALFAWAVVCTFGLMAIISALALIFPDGEWEARPGDIVAMLTWAALGAALALSLSLWWWRSTAPSQ